MSAGGMGMVEVEQGVGWDGILRKVWHHLETRAVRAALNNFTLGQVLPTWLMILRPAFAPGIV